MARRLGDLSSFIGLIGTAVTLAGGVLLAFVGLVFRVFAEVFNGGGDVNAEIDLMKAGLFVAAVALLGAAGSGMMSRHERGSDKGHTLTTPSGSASGSLWVDGPLIAVGLVASVVGYHPKLGAVLMLASGVGVYAVIYVLAFPLLTSWWVWVPPAILVMGGILALTSAFFNSGK